MDISHIGALSKKLDQLPDFPCCIAAFKNGQSDVESDANFSDDDNSDEHYSDDGTESEEGSSYCADDIDLDFDSMPNCLSYHTLVDSLPCYNPANDPSYVPRDSRDGVDQARANYETFSASKPFRSRQVAAIDSFKLIDREVKRTLEREDVSLVDIKQYAACFDDFFFEGKLLERCTIEWADNKSLKDDRCGASGVTYPQFDCERHRQCHGMAIELERNYLEFVGKKEQLVDVLSTLLHEMSHAWVDLFMTREMSFSDAIELHGPTGHGMVWKNVFRMCVWAAKDHFDLVCIDVEDEIVENDRDTATVIAVKRLMELESEALSSTDFASRISTALNVREEHSKLYPRLIERGCGKMEALVLIWGGSLPLWTSPELDVDDILPSNSCKGEICQCIGEEDEKDGKE